MAKLLYRAKRFQRIYNDIVHYPALSHVALAFGVHEQTVREWVSRAQREGLQLVDRNAAQISPEAYQYGHKIAELNAKIGRLQSDLREAYQQSTTNSKLMELFYGAKDFKFSNDREWLTYTKGKREGLTGIPVLFLSDIHYDEVVNPAEVEYLNQYNRQTADKRIKHTFNSALDLLTKKMHSPKYEGSIVMLGGDLLSGQIHQELAETNEHSILKSLYDLSEILSQGIGQFADEFGKVYVPCVVGNHGRMHHKPRAKGRVIENYEWLIFQLLAKHFRSDTRVSFEIPESSDLRFDAYNKRFLLTHGDQFSGGSGISGIFPPLMIGRARKLQRHAATNSGFDVLCMGHWHQYLHTDHLLINGCFPAGQKVVMANGLHVPIENIQVGDLVLSHSGDSNRVLELMRRLYCGPMFNIWVGSSASEIRCTLEHPILAIKGNQNQPEWVPAKFLSVGDYIQVTRPKSDTVRTTYDLDFMWMLGFCLSEGSASEKDEKLQGSQEKRISDEIMKYPPSHLYQILLGWLKGDGQVQRQAGGCYVSGSTQSSELMQQLFYIALKCGLNPSLMGSAGAAQASNIIGFSGQDACKLALDMGLEDVEPLHESEVEGSKFIEFGGQLFARISHMWAVDADCEVYNLEVEHDNSYTVNNLAVHNSIKGLDEYSYISNFGFERPQQALFVVHPDHGITFRMPVLCDPMTKHPCGKTSSR